MLDVFVSPFFALAYGAVLLTLLGVSLARLIASFRKAEAFLLTTSEWTLQVRNEHAFFLYKKNVAEQALAQGGLHSVWSEFLDEIHIRYNSEGHPLAESSTEALDKVKHDLLSTFDNFHKVTRLTAPALAVLGLMGAVFAVGVGALSAAPFLQETPADAPKALAALFSAGGLAFVAASAGLLGAIAFRAIERWQTQRVERRVDALANHLRGFVSFRGEPFFLAELAYTLRADRVSVKEFGQELLLQLEKGGQDARASTERVVSALASQTDSLSAVTREQAGIVVSAVVSAVQESARELAQESAKAAKEPGEVVSLARNQLEVLRSLESAVHSLEVKVVQGLERTADAVVEGGARSGTGFRVAFEEHGRNVRQALDKLSADFGAALHVSARDLHDSLGTLPDSLASRLKDVHAVHFAEATVLAKLVHQASVSASGEEIRHEGSIVMNEAQHPVLMQGLHHEPFEASKTAEALATSVFERSHGPSPLHSDPHVDPYGSLVSPSHEDPHVGPQSSLVEIPATVQVMLGCLELLQSGLRGLSTVRAQLDYLRDTSDRLRRLLSDVQAAAFPMEGTGELPEWWNARATRVVEVLARVDEMLSSLKETASSYDSLAEAALGENFVRLGRSTEHLWNEKEVPAIVENLWSGSRTPSQLVKSVTAMKMHLSVLCRALLGAQRHALSLEKELVEVWNIARNPAHDTEVFWKELEEKALGAGRRGKVVGAARKRVVFPSAEMDAEVLPALVSLARLVEETEVCMSNRSSKLVRSSEKLSKVG